MLVKEQEEKCLFTTELVLEDDMLCFEPAESQFHATIGDILIQFQECCRAVPNLLPDPLFHSFTRSVLFTNTTVCPSHSVHACQMYPEFVHSRPLINGQLEEKVCGEGPGLEDVFEDDSHLEQLNNSIQVFYIHT